MKYIFLALFYLLSLNVLAKDTPVERWDSLLTDFSLNKEDHSFCYLDKEQLKGRNIYKKVRLASVSKLLTTYWAINKLGVDYKYENKIYYKDGKMFIKGDLDPLLSDRKIFFLISQLNKLGITHIKELIFDSKFKVFTKAEKYSGSIINISAARTLLNLKDFLNVDGWNKLLVVYNKFIENTPNSLLKSLNIKSNVKDLDLKVDKITFRDHSELEKKENEVEKYIMYSSLISKYMKFMNIHSNNYMADQIFNKLGGEEKFDEFISNDLKDLIESMKDKATGYAKDEKLLKMYTGSGLNTKRNDVRVDNYANCGLITHIIKKLDLKLETLKNNIWNIVAVPGSDGGTFRSRLKSPRLKNTFIAKTGTLFHTCAIAGEMFEADKEKTYFGIFHQVEGWKGNIRIMQDKTLTYLWESLNIDNKFNYSPEFFFPASTNLVKF